MNKLKILTEWSPWEYEKEPLNEDSSASGGKVVMKGILQKANTLNQNGRRRRCKNLQRNDRVQRLLRNIRSLQDGHNRRNQKSIQEEVA